MESLSGSDVVVLTGADAAPAVAVHSPAAVVVMLADAPACKEVLHETLFPRGRVIGAGVAGPLPLVDAVVLDRGAVLECLVCVREAGEYVPATVRVGARGVQEIL